MAIPLDIPRLAWYNNTIKKDRDRPPGRKGNSMKWTIIVTEKEWNTIYTALKIEAERNADLDADEDQRRVQADIQAAIEAVQKASFAGF